jgi:hypothetical protein
MATGAFLGPVPRAGKQNRIKLRYWSGGRGFEVSEEPVPPDRELLLRFRFVLFLLFELEFVLPDCPVAPVPPETPAPF